MQFELTQKPYGLCDRRFGGFRSFLSNGGRVLR